MVSRLFRSMKWVFITSAAAALFCPAHLPAAESAKEPDQNRIVSADLRFGFNLFQEILKTGADTNVFVSPVSVAMALTMTYNGAAGDTQKAMAKVLALDEMSLEDVNRSNAALKGAIEGADPKVQLLIANSLWARNDITFKPDFIRRNKEFYGAEVTSLDFASPQAAPTINGWVSKNTNGKIREIVDSPIPPDMVLYLINAVYFKGDWSRPFPKNATQERDFTLLNGAPKKVPMMTQRGKYNYFRGEKFQAVSLPYGQERLSMYVFLPDKESSLKEFNQQLTAEKWPGWMAQFQRTDGDIMLPRFKIEWEKKLNDTLKAMDMAVAFDPSRADFRALAAVPTFISIVKHKTFVEVNEEGTEAAAATSVGMALTAIREEQKRFNMVVDRPFFVAIRDNATGLILFMGNIVEPK